MGRYVRVEHRIQCTPVRPDLSDGYGDSATFGQVYPASGVPLGEWSQFAFVYNGAQFQAYENGLASGGISTPSKALAAATGVNLTLGTPNWSAVYYQGSFNDVRIDNRALSAAEIMALYTAEHVDIAVAALNSARLSWRDQKRKTSPKFFAWVV